MALSEFKITYERRPCFVKGKRAMFHRWADAARPVVPHGLSEEDVQDRWQHHSVRGIVEFEDGSVSRCWPSDIVFCDGGGFEEIAWPEPKLPWKYPETKNRQPAHQPAGECHCCTHGGENAEHCAAANYVCSACTVTDCICRHCDDGSKWEWNGGDNGKTATD